MRANRLRPPSRVLLRPRPLAPLNGGHGHFVYRERVWREALANVIRRVVWLVTR